ncbi:MAG: DUF3373 domain-containing protein [Desulfuromonas sp.]|nr:MAG: DUF3373 domain-containing protein [Desulfuromonas sp.]
MRKLMTLLLAFLLALPAIGTAATNEDLQKMIDDLQEQIYDLQDQADAAEFHSSTDRLQITGDFRNRVHSLHYQDTLWNPGLAVNLDNFFFDAANQNLGPFNPANLPGAPTSDIERAFAAIATDYPDVYNDILTKFGAWSGGTPAGIGFMPIAHPKNVAKDIDNDVDFNTRLRLNMMAKVASNVSFAGRLAMYKSWGDSAGTQVLDSWNAFTMDGTNGGNTIGNLVQVERAFFNWKNIGGSNFWFSVGRRPSSYGSPSNYRENEMRGGSPSGHLVHFNFDGFTLGYAPDNGPEGMKIRFCYGQGYESQNGNGELFNNISTDDTNLGGFAIDAYDDGKTMVQVMAFGAFDVTDGFKGTFAFPSEFAAIFAPTMWQDMQNFDNMNFVTRYMPSTNIGDILLGSIGFSREEKSGLSYFGSVGWTQLRPNGKGGMFGGMASDTIFEAQGLDLDYNGTNETFKIVPTGTTLDDSNQDGYGVYVGVQIPTTTNGKLGLEYNYGSEYWTPFTQAQDDPIGSKLATRGSVYEGYYIHNINPNTFVKFAGLFYDYEYTGSGSPVGKPQKVDDVLAGTAYSMLPVVDTAWDANITFTIRF